MLSATSLEAWKLDSARLSPCGASASAASAGEERGERGQSVEGGAHARREVAARGGRRARAAHSRRPAALPSSSVSSSGGAVSRRNRATSAHAAAAASSGGGGGADDGAGSGRPVDAIASPRRRLRHQLRLSAPPPPRRRAASAPRAPTAGPPPPPPPTAPSSPPRRSAPPRTRARRADCAAPPPPRATARVAPRRAAPPPPPPPPPPPSPPPPPPNPRAARVARPRRRRRRGGGGAAVEGGRRLRSHRVRPPRRLPRRRRRRLRLRRPAASAAIPAPRPPRAVASCAHRCETLDAPREQRAVDEALPSAARRRARRPGLRPAPPPPRALRARRRRVNQNAARAKRPPAARLATWARGPRRKSAAYGASVPSASRRSPTRIAYTHRAAEAARRRRRQRNSSRRPRPIRPPRSRRRWLEAALRRAAVGALAVRLAQRGGERAGGGERFPPRSRPRCAPREHRADRLRLEQRRREAQPLHLGRARAQHTRRRRHQPAVRHSAPAAAVGASCDGRKRAEAAAGDHPAGTRPRAPDPRGRGPRTRSAAPTRRPPRPRRCPRTAGARPRPPPASLRPRSSGGRGGGAGVVAALVQGLNAEEVVREAGERHDFLRTGRRSTEWRAVESVFTARCPTLTTLLHSVRSMASRRRRARRRALGVFDPGDSSRGRSGGGGGNSAGALRGVLSDAEISRCCASRRLPADAVVSYGNAHEVRYLHRSAPRSSHLIERLIAAMRASEICGGSGGALRVRCIELHTYAVGGGLMERGHRDKGSAISLSALLTAPGGGGAFMTWDADGGAVEHAPQPGDAVVFASERTHNVSLVTSGTRQTVVIELWDGGINSRDRYSYDHSYRITQPDFSSHLLRSSLYSGDFAIRGRAGPSPLYSGDFAARRAARCRAICDCSPASAARTTTSSARYALARRGRARRCARRAPPGWAAASSPAATRRGRSRAAARQSARRRRGRAVHADCTPTKAKPGARAPRRRRRRRRPSSAITRSSSAAAPLQDRVEVRARCRPPRATRVVCSPRRPRRRRAGTGRTAGR